MRCQEYLSLISVIRVEEPFKPLEIYFLQGSRNINIPR